MQLTAGLLTTEFQPPRGYGLDAVPDTGRSSLQSASFHTLEEVSQARSLCYEAGRLFLGRIDQTMVGVRDNRHIVTVAGSRSGKSACLLIPNLLLYPGSALVIDPKGELAEASAVHRAERLGHDVAILDPFHIVKGDAARFRRDHNPLRELDIEGPDLIDDAAAMSEALVIESGNDPHWSIAARNLLTALLLMAALTRRSLAEIRLTLSGDPLPLWDLMSSMRPSGGEPDIVLAALEIIRAQGSSFLHKNDREAASILSVAVEQLAFLQSPAMHRHFEGHDIGLASLKNGGEGDRPTTIYVVLPGGRMTTHNRWLRLLVTQALLHFERLPTDPARLPILMILEEFAALGHLRPIEQAAGFIAGSGVRLWSVLQDLSQLKTHYKDGWETFLGNAGIIQAFSVADLTTCEYLSKLIGETTVETTRKESVGTNQFRGGDTGERREFRTVPLLTPAELAIEFGRVSENGEARGGLSLVLMPGLRPFVVDRVFWKDLR